MKKKRNLYDLINAINNLGELNIVLNLLKNNKFENWVLKECIYSKAGIVQKIPNADDLIELSVQLKLVYRQQNKNKKLIVLSKLGRKFINIRQLEKDRLSKEQGIFLLSDVFGQLGILKNVLSVVQIFNEDEDGTFWVNRNDKRIKDFEGLILRILQQAKIAAYHDEKYLLIR